MLADSFPSVAVDLCLGALLQDLAELDDHPRLPKNVRAALIGSALESIDYLLRAGGGSLGEEKLHVLRDALSAELKKVSS
jgi:hypothetical protein